jgi:prevent-host-death family protein
MANEKIPLTDARRHFGSMMDKIHDGDHIELTEHGYRIAVVVPASWYDKHPDTHE